MTQAYINKIEYYLPPQKESNANLLKIAGKDKYKIKKMIKKIGIKTRRIAGKNIFSNDLALKSAKKILNYINRESIDHLIYCTNTPDFLLPTNACILQNKLKLKKNIGAFDIILACSGYIYSLSVAKSLIVSGQAKNILVVTSDTYSKFIQKNNVNTRILFGDGSASTLVSSKKKHNSYQVHSFAYGTDGSGYKNAIINNFGSRYWHNPKKGGETLNLDGPGIYDFALKTVPTAISEYLSKNNILLNKIDYFIFHQANEYIIRNLQIKLQIPNKKILMNMSNIGNTVSSSIPIVLHKHSDKIPSKKNILLIGFGGGLSWGVCLIKK